MRKERKKEETGGRDIQGQPATRTDKWTDRERIWLDEYRKLERTNESKQPASALSPCQVSPVAPAQLQMWVPLWARGGMDPAWGMEERGKSRAKRVSRGGGNPLRGQGGAGRKEGNEGGVKVGCGVSQSGREPKEGGIGEI